MAVFGAAKHFEFNYPMEDAMKMRRALAFFAILLCLAGLATAGEKYPNAWKGRDTYRFFEHTILDPFRWLEGDGRRQAYWLEDQQVLFEKVLVGNSRCDQIARRVDELGKLGSLTTPLVFGGKYYCLERAQGKQLVALTVSETYGGDRTVIFDPNSLPDESREVITNVYPSPDGKHVAMRLSKVGNDWGRLGVLRVSDGVFVESIDAGYYPVNIDTNPVEWLVTLAWKPDSTGFWYNRRPALATEKEIPYPWYLFWHQLGHGASEDVAVPVVGGSDKIEKSDFPTRLEVTADGKWLLLNFSFNSKGHTVEQPYIMDLTKSDAGFVKVPVEGDGFHLVKANGNDLFILTKVDVGRGRIMKVPLERVSDGPSSWTEVLAESRTVIQNFWIDGDKLVVSSSLAGIGEISVYNLQGAKVADVPTPVSGTITQIKVGDEKVVFVFSSVAIPPTVYEYDIPSTRLTILRKIEVPGINPADYAIGLKWVRTGGVEIPVHLFGRNNGIQPRPMVLFVYGCYSITYGPGFSNRTTAILDQGVDYAIAGVRGGGEFGEDWHEGGSGVYKSNTTQDLIGVAEALIRDGHTTPAELGLYGGSCGGLAVLIAANHRPDLFGAVVASAPITDAIYWTTRKGETGNATSESGDMSRPGEFGLMLNWSPIHNVLRSVEYPPVLLVTGAKDDRVPPLHSFKMVATLQSQARGGPFFLYVKGGGHAGSAEISKAAVEHGKTMGWLIEQIAPKSP